MSLEALIKKRIREHGAITVADYMSLCLMHPEYGYYMRRDPFGVQGDFITAPEISQIFGELLGMWLAATNFDSDAGRAQLLDAFATDRCKRVEHRAAHAGDAGFDECVGAGRRLAMMTAWLQRHVGRRALRRLAFQIR